MMRKQVPTTTHTPSPLTNGSSRVDEFTLHGIIFALAVSFSAEIILGEAFATIDYWVSISRVSIIYLSVYVIHRFSVTALAKYKPSFRDLVAVCLVVVASLVMVWLGRIIAMSLLNQIASWSASPQLEPDCLFYLIPYATGALLLQSVLGIHFATVFTIIFSLVMGVYYPNQLILNAYILSTCFVGCLSLSFLRSRTALVLAVGRRSKRLFG